MEILVNYILESEYYTSNAGEVFEDTRRARSFGLLSGCGQSFRFAWESTVVTPEVTKIDECIYAIGIDLNFALVNFRTNSIPLKIDLVTYFLQTILFEDSLFIATQSEIIRVSKVTLVILKTYGLPDVFEKMIFEDGKIKVQCFEDIIVEFDL